MNYRSNLREVVRTRFPLLSLSFLSEYSHCVLVLLPHSPKMFFFAAWIIVIKHDASKVICVSVSVTLSLLCAAVKNKIVEESKIKRSISSVLSRAVSPTGRSLSSLSAFSFSSCSFIYIFVHFFFLLEQRIATRRMGIKARWSKH